MRVIILYRERVTMKINIIKTSIFLAIIFLSPSILYAKTKLEDLNAGKEELEKFAREKYFMKKENEDVFVIIRE